MTRKLHPIPSQISEGVLDFGVESVVCCVFWFWVGFSGGVLAGK